MKKLIIALYLLAHTLPLHSQTLGGYTIADYLVNAIHPNGCSDSFITGLPDDSIWVNFEINEFMTGNFGLAWTDLPGNELVLETGFHSSNYIVSLYLSTGQYSSSHNVAEADWTQITDTTWHYTYGYPGSGCTESTQPDNRFILPLDFSLHFGLTSSDIVTGIKIIFLETVGWPDLAGVYITSTCPAMAMNTTLTNESCKGDTNGAIDLSVSGGGGTYTYLWSNGATTQDISNLASGNYSVTVTQNTDCFITGVFTIQEGVDLPISITQNGDTLSATTAPNYQWYLNDTIITGATNQNYEITESGNYYVVTSTDSCTFTSNNIETTCICVGIEENDFSEMITLYPNPASTTLTIQSMVNSPWSVVNIYNAQGALVLTTSNIINQTLNIENLSAGLYYLHLQSAEGTATKKFEVIK